MRKIVAAMLGILFSFSSFARADQWTASEWAYQQHGEGMLYVLDACTVWASLQQDQLVASVVEGNGDGGRLQVITISRDQQGVARLKRELPPEAQAAENDAFYATCGSKLPNLPLQVRKMFAGYYGLQ